MRHRNILFRLAPLALAAHLAWSGPAAAQGAPGTQGPLTPAPDAALAAQIDQRAKAIEDKLIAWRRDIHQHPELGNQETRTAKLVADHLRALGMEVKTGVAVTGVVAVLKGGKPGPVVALRADMDALPVKEQVDLPFASQAKGTYLGKEVDVMHACGHDTHTAILMATAEVLAGMKDELPGSVKFIFQPAEESPCRLRARRQEDLGRQDDGAGRRDGKSQVDAIFGLHASAPIRPAGWPGAAARRCPPPTSSGSTSPASRRTARAPGPASIPSWSARRSSWACRPFPAARSTACWSRPSSPWARSTAAIA